MIRKYSDAWHLKERTCTPLVSVKATHRWNLHSGQMDHSSWLEVQDRVLGTFQFHFGRCLEPNAVPPTSNWVSG